jgi:hypothetical protein
MARVILSSTMPAFYATLYKGCPRIPWSVLHGGVFGQMTSQRVFLKRRTLDLNKPRRNSPRVEVTHPRI